MIAEMVKLQASPIGGNHPRWTELDVSFMMATPLADILDRATKHEKKKKSRKKFVHNSMINLIISRRRYVVRDYLGLL